MTESWNCNYYKCSFNSPKWMMYCVSCKRFYEGLKPNDTVPIFLDKYEDSTILHREED